MKGRFSYSTYIVINGMLDKSAIPWKTTIKESLGHDVKPNDK